MKSPAFQLYPEAVLSDMEVRLMNNREFGVYMKLLLHSWLENGLPQDHGSLSVLANEDPRDFDVIWQKVGKKFKKKGSKLFNSRLERERKKQKDFCKSQSVRAIKLWEEKNRQKTQNVSLPSKPRHSHGIIPASPPLALPAMAMLSVSVSKTTDTTPLTPLEEKLLNYLKTTPPLTALREPELFVRRLVDAHGVAKVEAGARELVSYCAGKPEWEKSKKNWNLTLYNWIKRNAEKSKKSSLAGTFGKTITP